MQLKLLEKFDSCTFTYRIFCLPVRVIGASTRSRQNFKTELLAFAISYTVADSAVKSDGGFKFIWRRFQFKWMKTPQFTKKNRTFAIYRQVADIPSHACKKNKQARFTSLCRQVKRRSYIYTTFVLPFIVLVFCFSFSFFLFSFHSL